MTVTEWKSVYGTVEARETVPARARIGGIVQSLSVTEGDSVTAGQEIAVIHDDKIAFQIAALDAQIEALKAHSPPPRPISTAARPWSGGA